MAERCAGSSILTNTNTVREYLFAPLRCFVARHELLFVVRSLLGVAHAMRKEGHSMAPGPQNRLRFDRAEVLRKLCGILIKPYRWPRRDTLIVMDNQCLLAEQSQRERTRRRKPLQKSST